jgi:hypothetical protein
MERRPLPLAVRVFMHLLEIRIAGSGSVLIAQ